MSDFQKTLKHYLSRSGSGLAHVIPGPGNFAKVFSSAAKGALLSFVLICATGLVLGLGLTFTGTLGFFDSVRAGALVAVAGFGTLLGVSDQALGYEANIGIHSGLLLILGIVISRMSFRKALDNKANLSAFHFAFGFALVSLLVTVGLSGTISGLNLSANLSGPVWYSGLTTLLVIWLSTALIQRSQPANAMAWSRLMLATFAKLYASLVALAVLVVTISLVINPIFAEAQEAAPAANPMDLKTSLAFIALVLLFGVNLLLNLFLGALGLPIGMSASTNIPGLDPLVAPLSQINGSVIQLFGPWAFMGIALLVALVAMISGSIASKKLGLNLGTAVHFWQSFGASVAISMGLVYFGGLQAWVGIKTQDGQTQAAFVWGASLTSVFVLVTAVNLVGFWAASRLDTFTSHAFPRVFGRFGVPQAGSRKLGSRVFGLITSLALLGVGLTPLVSSAANLVWAVADAPANLGREAAEKILKANLKDLKSFLLDGNKKASFQWLDDAILESARLDENSKVAVSVTNNLGKNWRVGNLDANVRVDFGEGKNASSFFFGTDSTLNNPSWLIYHPTYDAKVKPTTLSVQLNPDLQSQASKLNLTVNGKKVKPGTYLGIPGKYSVKADGFKLIAPTDRTFFTTENDFSIQIGTEVKLPKGAVEKLNKAINEKSSTCMKPNSSGTAQCLKKSDFLDAGKITKGNQPAEYFDSEAVSFEVTKISCDLENAKDALTSASKMTRTADCKITVRYSERFFKTGTKRVPIIETQTVCEGENVSNAFGTRVYWNSSWGRWEDSVYWYRNDQVRWDPCYYSTEKDVVTGYEDAPVRGALITTVTKEATVTKSITVVGTLDAKDEFAAK